MKNQRIRFGFFGGPQNEIEFYKMADGLGVDALAWGESPTQFPDPYLCMLQAAQHTKSALLGKASLETASASVMSMIVVFNR